MNMKKLAEIVRDSGKNERLDEPKTRKGGSCKNEIDNVKTSNYIWQITTTPWGICNCQWSFSSEASVLVNSKFLWNVVVIVFNVPPTNKITIFQAL